MSVNFATHNVLGDIPSSHDSCGKIVTDRRLMLVEKQNSNKQQFPSFHLMVDYLWGIANYLLACVPSDNTSFSGVYLQMLTWGWIRAIVYADMIHFLREALSSATAFDYWNGFFSPRGIFSTNGWSLLFCMMMCCVTIVHDIILCGRFYMLVWQHCLKRFLMVFVTTSALCYGVFAVELTRVVASTQINKLLYQGLSFNEVQQYIIAEVVILSTLVVTIYSVAFLLAAPYITGAIALVGVTGKIVGKKLWAAAIYLIK